MILANSEDPDEMPQYAAFHLGLHCLSKYLFSSFQNDSVNNGLGYYYKLRYRFIDGIVSEPCLRLAGDFIIRMCCRWNEPCDFIVYVPLCDPKMFPHTKS